MKLSTLENRELNSKKIEIVQGLKSNNTGKKENLKREKCIGEIIEQKMSFYLLKIEIFESV